MSITRVIKKDERTKKDIYNIIIYINETRPEFMNELYKTTLN